MNIHDDTATSDVTSLEGCDVAQQRGRADEISRTGSESEESEGESRGKDSDGSAEEMSSDDLEDNSVYRGWCDDAVEASQQSRTEKFEKYLKVSEDRAREKAYARTVWAIKNDFFDSFGTFLEQIQLIQKDETYQDILSDIEENVEGGMDVRKAVKRVLPNTNTNSKAILNSIRM